MLHCPGSTDDKIQVFFNAIKGLNSTVGNISATDTNAQAVINKLCSLVAVDVYQLMLEVEGTPQIFTQEQLQTISSKFGVIQNELYADAVFDVSSRLEYAEWKNAIK